MRISPIKSGTVLIALLALGGVAIATFAHAEEPLRWKFKVGEKLNYDMVQDMKMAISGPQIPLMNTTMHQEMNMTWDVQGVDEKSGEAVIRQKFDHVKMKMTSPLGGFDYDSKSDQPPTGLAAMVAPMYKAMTEGEFEITMTARGEVKDVKIPQQVLTALKNSPAAASMGDIASPDGFKKMISQGALVLPKDPPKQGDSWTTKVEMKNPAFGMQTIQTTYRYEGTKEIKGTKYAVIRPKLKMEFESVPTENELSNTPSGIKWDDYLTDCGLKAQRANEARTKKDFRETYRAKLVAWSGKVSSVSEVKGGGFDVGVIMEPSESISGVPDVRLKVPPSLQNAVIKLNKGDTITFTGNLIKQGGQIVSLEIKARSIGKNVALPEQLQQPPQQQQMQMKIKDQSSDGEVLFNMKAGRLQSTTLKQNVTIDATVSGAAMQQKIDQKINVTVTPAGEKKSGEAKKPDATSEKTK